MYLVHLTKLFNIGISHSFEYQLTNASNHLIARDTERLCMHIIITFLIIIIIGIIIKEVVIDELPLSLTILTSFQ